jgi:glucose/mannose-6-phosphate isomerase
MKTLDEMETIHKVDQHNMLKLIHDFSEQLRHAEEIGNKAELDASLGKGIQNIVFSGLGGSAIGADLIRSYLQYELPVPIAVNRHYRLPGYVSDKTLLVVSSYSGSTEETLSSLSEGLRRKARILAITSGGEVARLAKRHRFPQIEIPKSLPPRAALGYSVIPLLIALSKVGFKQAYRADDVREARELVRKLSDTAYGMSVPAEKNLAKQLAKSCFQRYPIVYGGTDYFDVVALRWRGQIEENGKVLASHHVIPEMNHNELVGWKFPKALLKEIVVFILRDKDDHARVKRRMDLSREIIRPLAGEIVEINSQGSSRLARIFSLVHLGDWASLYLAALNDIDPTPVEVINFLKSELAKETVS